MQIGEFAIGYDKPQTRTEDFDFSDIELTAEQREESGANADVFDCGDGASSIIGVDDDVIEVYGEGPGLHGDAVSCGNTEFSGDKCSRFASCPCSYGRELNERAEGQGNGADEGEDDAERDRKNTSTITACSPCRASVRRNGPAIHGFRAYLSAVRRAGVGRGMCSLPLRRKKILKHARCARNLRALTRVRRVRVRRTDAIDVLGHAHAAWLLLYVLVFFDWLRHQQQSQQWWECGCCRLRG